MPQSDASDCGMQLITGDDNKSIKMRVIERIEKAVALDIEEYESL